MGTNILEINRINSKTAFFVLKEAATHVTDGGKIITIVTALLGAFTGYYTSYAGSKAPVEHFTRYVPSYHIIIKPPHLSTSSIPKTNTNTPTEASAKNFNPAASASTTLPQDRWTPVSYLRNVQKARRRCLTMYSK